MSCPYMHKKKVRDDNFSGLMEQFQKLLPDCGDFLSVLKKCRDKVVREGSGHCASQSQVYQQCWGNKQKSSKAILDKCTKTSHEELSLAYDTCMAKAADSVVEREKCLAPIESFLDCAKSV